MTAPDASAASRRVDPSLWACFAIAAAVHRTVDERPSWHPEQRLTVAEAVAASTGSGTVPVVGAVADLVLTGADPATADRATLAAMPVRMTVVGGRVTHRG